MNLASITSLVLLLLGKREELLSIVKEATELFQKIKAVWPTLADDLTEVIPSSPPPLVTEYSVLWLQQSLNELTGSKLMLDGDYGAETKAAVKKFQAANGLTVDGWAGVQTQAAMVAALGR